MSDPELTAVERRALYRSVLARHSSVRVACEELGITRHVMTQLFQRAGESASQWLGRTNIPEGHRIKGNSTLTDAESRPLTRWVKTEEDSAEEPRFLPLPPEHTVKSTSTMIGPQGEVRQQWVTAKKDEATRWQEFWEAVSKATEAYKGLAEPAPAPAMTEDRFLTAYPLGDPHVGMLSWARETGDDFDLSIARQGLISVVDMLVDRAPPAKTGLLVNVGDFFHAEDDNQRTPSAGNKLDVDSRALKIAEVGFTTMRRLIDRMLLKHAEVEVVNTPGNHDPKMARMMAVWLKAVYEREPRVKVIDNANPYMYRQFGKTLIGMTHGDSCKPEDLPGIMAADEPAAWGSTVDRFWLTGHIHHLTRKEYTGRVIVETFRTLAPRDYWHHSKGYRSGQSLCSITFDVEYGEDVRVTVPLRRAKA